jgi:hypothetical protein
MVQVQKIGKVLRRSNTEAQVWNGGIITKEQNKEIERPETKIIY